VASNLESFKRKREELQEQLKAALEKLPESSDLPALLTNITGLGKKSGLEIQTFRQGKKIDRGFYSEQQIELQFSGAYHDIGLFFDRIASLSRIVNLSDLTFEVESETGETPMLSVKGIAATFYFNESSTGAATTTDAPKPKTAGGE
jgi:type IV pilus assembly protein PilO